MAYDTHLSDRIECYLKSSDAVELKKMFGGVAFMVRCHMCVGVVDDQLMARVGPEQYDQLLQNEYATEMTFTGRPMKGLLYIDSDGVAQDDDLHFWIDRCLKFVASLPDKKKKK